MSGIKINYDNSNSDQRELISACIGRDLLTSQTMLVSELLQKSIFDFDDIINFHIKKCSRCGEEISECSCSGDGDPAANAESEPKEIYEWYLLADRWIAEKLIASGEVVLSNEFGFWWGRTCFGQAILLDSTFWNIYQEELQRH